MLATRESALQLCLLQEDFGLIRTVRVHGMEDVDKRRFDEHLERYHDAEIRRMLNESKINPTATILLIMSGGHPGPWPAGRGGDRQRPIAGGGLAAGRRLAGDDPPQRSTGWP